MTDNDAIEILNELWRYERTEKYTDIQIRLACEHAINKIRNYHDLLNHYIALSKTYADFKEWAKHEIPLPDYY